MKTTCRKCGDSFVIDKESEKLINEGFLSLADANICNDCFDILEKSYFEYEQQSDADPGL
jgi:hypothetical protein